MKILFNDNWQFAELPLDSNSLYKDGTPVLFSPDDFYDDACSNTLVYTPVNLPHDWQIWHVTDLYKNSVGCYKKTFELSKEQAGGHVAIAFEGVYMNCAVWVNGKKAGEWKYGYSNFEFDISSVIQAGKNDILVIAVYENCNTRWYSGAGIYRDVELITTGSDYLISDGNYFHAENDSDDLTGPWKCHYEVEAVCSSNCKIKFSLVDSDGKTFFVSEKILSDSEKTGTSNHLTDFNQTGTSNHLTTFTTDFTVTSPRLWDLNSPKFYILKTELLSADGKVSDACETHCGFKTALFTSDKGFFLNGHHVKIQGACHHHDQGALGSAFDVNALRRQFTRLKEMGVNAIRCSHNPPPRAWLDLCDEMGLLVDDEAFDMWEKSKTPFDYGNYFNDWYERDTTNWIRKDRNHPSVIMWSIGNEIYDTHQGNGFEITKKLSAIVRRHDPLKNAQITIGSNYMMCDGAQECANLIDTVGYNYLERLYKEHHEKYPDWKIYGSETSSTVQSRGIYHFPETLNLVTFDDGQCSCLGNCSTPWSAKNTQTVITNERDCDFSAGQFIWTGWDYIGEPTPYHSKNSYFGQIDTAGFPKDTFFLYKSLWNKVAKPFVHILPYWDWNEGQIIDVKAYSNCKAVELFVNGKSEGLQKIDAEHGMEPFGRWQVAYHKGQIEVRGYDSDGKEIASETKRSFGDPAQILMKPEPENFGNLFFIDLMLTDQNGELVENARNYITFNVAGKAELVGMDNGDSTDWEEYKSDNITHTRRLFGNRLVAIVRAKTADAAASSFVITAASKDLPTVSMKWDGKNWSTVAPYYSIHAVEDYVPVRKIEICYDGDTKLTPQNREVHVACKVLPENATEKAVNLKAVLKECVPSDFIEISQNNETIKAVSDGECLLRCTAKNGTALDQIISDLNFSVSGIGTAHLDPFKLIEACRHTDWDGAKEKCDITLESGASNRGVGPTWLSFDKVDFGADGADTIHLPVFSFETELPLEVWDGKPGDGTTWEGSTPSTTGGICLGKFTYRHESIYNTYMENVFKLNRRLFGIHTISIVLPHELYFHGFYFDKTPKAFAHLNAFDCDMVTGDSFTKTDCAIEGIGNNVTVDFANMNFGETAPVSLTICGKSNSENNSINVKFFDNDGNSTTQVIEFAHTDDYEEKTFELSPVTGNKKVSFIFLPGCNFDFKWFKFNQ